MICPRRETYIERNFGYTEDVRLDDEYNTTGINMNMNIGNVRRTYDNITIKKTNFEECVGSKCAFWNRKHECCSMVLEEDIVNNEEEN